jgi:hypothetical protein
MVATLGWQTILAKTAQDALLHALDAFAKKTGLVHETPPVSSRAEKEVKEVAPVSAVKRPEESTPTPSEAASDAPTDVPSAEERERRDSGIPVAIPDIPVIEAGSDEDDEAPVTPNVATRNAWGGYSEESPKLAEARTKMMEMLGPPATPARTVEWTTSDVPEKPSSLEWPEPPQILSEEPKQAPPPPPVPKKGPFSPFRR